MSKELDKCSMDRDRYKILVEQLQCKKVVREVNSWERFAPTNTISGSEIIARTREQNNMLKLEVGTVLFTVSIVVCLDQSVTPKYYPRK